MVYKITCNFYSEYLALSLFPFQNEYNQNLTEVVEKLWIMKETNSKFRFSPIELVGLHHIMMKAIVISV